MIHSSKLQARGQKIDRGRYGRWLSKQASLKSIFIDFKIYPYLTKHRCLFLLNFVHSAEHIRHWVLRLLKPNRLIEADFQLKKDLLLAHYSDFCLDKPSVEVLRPTECVSKDMRTGVSQFLTIIQLYFNEGAAAEPILSTTWTSPHQDF